jgi:hypothetical protein
VPSAQTDQPRLRPLQQICVSLFDVSDGVEVSKLYGGQSLKVWYPLLMQAFIPFLKLLHAVLALPSSAGRQLDVDLPSFKFGVM